MLAFDDYVNGVKKATEVLKLAEQQLKTARKAATDTRAQVDVDVQELARLQALLASDTSPEALDGRFLELERAVNEAGYQLGSAEVRDTRALRAQLESAAEQTIRRQSTLDVLRAQAARARALQADLPSLLAVKEGRRLASLKADEEAAVAEAALLAAQTELNPRGPQATEATRLRDWYTWAISVHPNYARLVAECASLSVRQNELQADTARHGVVEERALALHANAVTALRRAEELSNAGATRRARLQAVGLSLELARSLPQQISLAKVDEAAAQTECDGQQSLLGEENQAALAKSLDVVRLERQLATAIAEASKLKGLIAELRGHVHGSSCLLCGHDHGSQEGLLAAIDRQTEQSAAVVQIGEDLAAERSKKLLLEGGVERRKALISQAQSRLEAARNHRVGLERQQQELYTSFVSAGLALDENVSTEHARLASEAADEEARGLASAAAAQQQLGVADSELAAARQQHAAAKAELQAVTFAIANAKQQVDEHLASARTGAIDLDAGLDRLQETHRKLEVDLATATTLLQSASAAHEQHRTSATTARAHATTMRSSLADAVKMLDACNAEFGRIDAALSAGGLTLDVSDERFTELTQELAGRASVALRLRDRAAELEVAVDAAATSAAFQSIRTRIDAGKVVLEAAAAQMAHVEPWVKYFGDVCTLLNGQQSLATNHFTTEYGPRTAVIQRRLRPVYGFQDIKVTTKDTSIEVHVSRNNQDLRPTDYFSQSQVQTLVLGLFLTACSTQTWSGFSSIMMDDPVTHFDDLNTYALLDLVSGLQSSSEGNKQFVISTCDEKLLQLARQKFRHLGEAAKFYRFSAIGVDGPLVAELPM
ncbi:hypothetical protein [Paucibacter sp. XJ19-41]|uniref:hypothetical protein n=1 Tax=Paucibacter sp. XJ19-41 TaxID=2927824 RepID=UPI00234A2F94|nr:hypothetical protein [Paucibacter sp. XJ19-41]MDC6169424.1 hypothetical protein [Paucibacter sp. XJ19-41]